MSATYEHCGGCGAETPSERCIGCLHDFGSGPIGASPTNTAGLEVVRIVACHLPGSDCPDTACLPITITAGDLRSVYAALVTAASAQARIAELEARVAELEATKWEAQHADTMNDLVAMGLARDAAEARADRLADGITAAMLILTPEPGDKSLTEREKTARQLLAALQDQPK